MNKSREHVIDTCKNGLGHQWDQVASTRTPMFGALLTFHCGRCGTSREDIVQYPGDGRLLSRSYYHPDDYKEVPKTTRGEWRGRVIEQAKRKVKVA